MLERKTPTIRRPPEGALGEGGKEEPLLNRKTQAQGGGAKERRKRPKHKLRERDDI